MTTRETSREAFEQLVASGAIKGHQAKILQAVIGGPDRTSGEVCAALGLDNVNAWRARFTELQERGIIAESGQRTCKQSGRRGVTWRFTGRTKPLVAKKRASAKELRDVAIDAIDLLAGFDAKQAKVLRDRLVGR
jgi:hypothetical protein